MPIQCKQENLKFHPLGKRELRAGFDGGAMTSDGGGLLLREVEKRTGIMAQFAACFRDHRKAERLEHRVEELVAQRVYGLALGYEDLNDHEVSGRGVRGPGAPRRQPESQRGDLGVCAEL